MEINATLVKQLREKTGVAMMDCKKALVEAAGDMGKAADILRIKGMAKAEKKADRSATEGVIGSYVHSNGKLGVMVIINCETDFVARNEDFKLFAKNIAMHIAACNPSFVKREEVPADRLAREKELFAAEAKESGKPEKVIDKIVEGKIEKFYQDVCLLEQPYVKDNEKTIGKYLTEIISKIGENVIIAKFVRMELGK